MRIARWVLGAAGALVLLAVAALLVATLLINPDRYKGPLERAATHLTGRPFVIEGHLELNWFPWLGVHTGAARLESAPGVGGPDLIDWRAAQVKVRLLPLLLHREIQLGRIRVRGADIHLRLDARGRSNWDDVMAHLRSSAGSGAPAGASAGSARALPVIGGLDLRDGSLEFLDQRTGTRLTVSGWQMRIGAFRAGRPVVFSTSFKLQGRKLPARGIPIELKALRLTFQGSPFSFSAPQLSLRLGSAELRGSAHLSRRAGRVDAAGSLAARVTSLRELLGTLGLGARLPKDPRTLRKLSLAGNWSYREGALAVKPLTATIDATRLTGWIDRSGGAHPLWRFMLRGNDIDFTRYLVPPGKRSKRFKLPVKELEALHAEGTLELERARIDGSILQNIRLEVR